MDIQFRAARSESRACEVSWFAPLCSDDYEYLGVPDTALKSSVENIRNIVSTAERVGFNNILLPSSFQVGLDPLCVAAAMSAELTKMNVLVALRMGEMHPPMLARSLATLDHMLKGRLTLNIICSDLPGTNLDAAERHERAREGLQILKQCFLNERVQFKGKFYNSIELNSTDPTRMYQQNGGPLFYFGGLSPHAKELCAEFCDVFLMWPETEERLAEHMVDMTERARKHDRLIDFGLRVHLIVRETETEARAAAKHLLSRLDLEKGAEIKARAQDAGSYGVGKQVEMRQIANADGFAEDILWTGIGLARSGCGCALVGTPAQVAAKISRYIDLGIRAFIFSGYPHLRECERVGELLLPKLETMSLPHFYNRIPASEPNTPLGCGPRQ